MQCWMCVCPSNSGSHNSKEQVITIQDPTFLISACGWVFSLPFEYCIARAIKPRGTYGMTEARSLLHFPPYQQHHHKVLVRNAECKSNT